MGEKKKRDAGEGGKKLITRKEYAEKKRMKTACLPSYSCYEMLFKKVN